MFVGVLLVLLGVLILLSQMEIIQGDIWDYFWPLAIITLGAYLVFKHTKRDPRPPAM